MKHNVITHGQVTLIIRKTALEYHMKPFLLKENV